MEETRANISFLLALLLDGVQKYNEENFAKTLPDYAELQIVVDPPRVKRWGSVKKLRKRDTVTIYGEEVSHGPGVVNSSSRHQLVEFV